MATLIQDSINPQRLSPCDAKRQLLANPRKGGEARVALKGALANMCDEAKATAPHTAPRNPGKVRKL